MHDVLTFGYLLGGKIAGSFGYAGLHYLTSFLYLNFLGSAEVPPKRFFLFSS